MRINDTLHSVLVGKIILTYSYIIILGIVALAQVESVRAEAEVQGATKNLRFNQLQYIGTHNSYHIAPGQAMGILMLRTHYKENEQWPAEKLVPAIDYTNVPITTQLELGLRQFELDVHYDPDGGKFANPGGLKALQANDLPITIAYDPQGELNHPGFKVLHHADFDVGSTCLRLVSCLNEIRQWSDANSNHFPIIIQIELKEDGKPAVADAYIPAAKAIINASVWQALEAELLSVFPLERVVTPDNVRGDHPNLKDAILKDGWPTLEKMAGKVIFIFILSQKKITDLYMEYANNTLQGRLLFPIVPFDHPEASLLSVSDPHDEKHPIISFVKQGFLVRIRSDKHTEQARNNDIKRRDMALQTGAHLISTDYAIPDRRFSNYQVKFPNGGYVRCNPITMKDPCPF